MPTFNWEVNLGAAISIAMIIFAAGGFVTVTRSLGKNLTDLAASFKDQMREVKDDLKLLNKVVTDQALSTQRQDNFEDATRQEFLRIRDDIKEMKHGRGFVNEAVKG